MPQRSMTYPHGQPLVPAMLLRRARPVPAGAQVRVRVGDNVSAVQPIAALPTGEPLLAGIAGRVLQVLPGQVIIEGIVRLLHGLLGIGEQVAGQLVLAPRPEEPAFQSVPRGAILLVPGRLTPMHLQGAAQVGAYGILGGSMSARDLESFARVDLTAVLDGAAPPPAVPLTVVLMDGIGEEAMDVRFAVPLTSALGSVVLVSGFTRARPLGRPEVLLAPADPLPMSVPLPHTLEVGAHVHVHAGPCRGVTGVIVSLPPQPEMIENHLSVPCAYVRAQDGNVLRLPVNVLDFLP